MHVCHLVHHLALGGLETQVLRLIRATDDPDVTYSVCYFGADDSMRAEFEDAGARVVDLGGSDTALYQFAPWRVLRFARFLRRADVDVLHVHTSLYLPVLARLCAAPVGVPVVGTYHNVGDLFSRPMRLAERLTRPLSATNVAVSKGVERSFANSAAEYRPGTGIDRRTYTVYNGIDVAEFAADVRDADVDAVRERWDVDPDALVFLSIGRYTDDKNQRSLVRAFSRVADDHPTARLIVVGWGPLEDDLRALAADLGVGDRVTITGRVPSVAEYYALADAFVLPSVTEGLSLVLLEAMAAGLPVVATDVAGTAEAVVDGETGYVVAPNDEGALADALVRLGDDDTRARLADAGFARVTDTFSIRATLDSYLDIYRTVTRASDGGRGMRLAEGSPDT